MQIGKGSASKSGLRPSRGERREFHNPNQTSALMKSEKIVNQNMVNTKAAGYTLSRGLWGQQRTNASGLILACFRLSNAYASVSPILANWGSGTRSGLAAKSSSPLLVGSAMFACRHICPFSDAPPSFWAAPPVTEQRIRQLEQRGEAVKSQRLILLTYIL
jgi:hypothetical protein